MNHVEFVKNFIYEDIIFDEIKCPIDNNICSYFVKPPTVLLRENSIFILGDNRSNNYFVNSEDTVKNRQNKLIIISNINLNNNSFDISYIESLPTERLYIFLFTGNVDLYSYNYGVTIGTAGSQDADTALFTTYDLFTNYLHPPKLSIDDGKLAFKLFNVNTNLYEYQHINIDFTLSYDTNPNMKLETSAKIKKNMEEYKRYFHGQITKYQNMYYDNLKLKELLKKIDEENKITNENNNKLLMQKYIIQGSLILVLIIIIGIYLYRTSKKNKDDTKKKAPKWEIKKEITKETTKDIKKDITKIIKKSK